MSAGTSFEKVLITIDNFLKVVNTSNGRDKATKVLQYSTRIVDDLLSSQSIPNKELIKRVQLFGNGLATARKVFRFWKPLSGYLLLFRFIQKLLGTGPNGAKKQAVQLVELLQLIEQVFIANYFLLDHLNWAAKLGLLSNEKISNAISPIPTDKSIAVKSTSTLKNLFNNSRAARYGQIGFTFWMYGALAGLIANIIKLIENVNREAALLVEMNSHLKQQFQQPTSEETGRRSKELEAQMLKLTQERYALIRKVIVSLCDFGTAASLSGHWQAKNWLVGVLGVVSAGIGVYEQWPSAQ
jgi:hypothetical protein